MKVSAKFTERCTQGAGGTLANTDMRPRSSLLDLKPDILVPGREGDRILCSPCVVVAPVRSPPPEPATWSPMAPRSGSWAEAQEVQRTQAMSRARENQPYSLAAPSGLLPPPSHPTSALCSGLQVWSALGRLILQSRVSKGHTGPSLAKGAGLPGTASCGEMQWGQAAELLGLLHGAPQTRGLAEHQSLPSRFWKSRCQRGWSFQRLEGRGRPRRLSQLLGAASKPQCSLACRPVSPISVVMRRSSLSMCPPLFL